MDALTCRTPDRCRTCEYAAPAGACRLEASLFATIAPRPLPPRAMLLIDRRASA